MFFDSIIAFSYIIHVWKPIDAKNIMKFCGALMIIFEMMLHCSIAVTFTRDDPIWFDDIRRAGTEKLGLG